jgi:hypothetical protein
MGAGLNYGERTVRFCGTSAVEEMLRECLGGVYILIFLNKPYLCILNYVPFVPTKLHKAG